MPEVIRTSRWPWVELVTGIAQTSRPSADLPTMEAAAANSLRPALPARAGGRVLIAAAVVVVAGFAALLHVQFGGAFVARATDDIGQSVAALVASIACTRRALRLRSRARWSWLLIGAATASWGIGELIWSYYELISSRETPFPSLADLGFLLFPAFALPGLLLRPSSAYAGTGRIRVVLDGVMVASALFVVSWQTALGSVFHGGAANSFAFAVGLAYPASDLVMLTVAVLVVVHSRTQRSDLVLVAGLVAMSVADSGFSYQTANGSYQTGSFVDIVWCAAFMLMGMSAVLFADGGRPRARRVDSMAWLVLPYVLVSVAIGFTAAGFARSHLDRVSLGVTGIALVAVLARQLLTVLDNRRLAAGLIARQDELHFQAFHDALTGLANRALFYDRVAHALALHQRDMRPVSLVFCDLDDFKAINDSMGHDAGDAVLVAVAERLNAVVRTGDTVARLGGDEFAVLLEDGGDTAELTERMLQALSAPIAVRNRMVPVQASIGRTTVDPAFGSADVQALMKQADVAMYTAKRAAKGCAVAYTPALDDDSGDVLDQRIALAADLAAGRMGVALQPIITADGRHCADEALARWSYLGAEMAPSHFIALAQRAGLLGALDLLVARTALTANTGVAPAPLVSINVGLAGEPAVAQNLGALLGELCFPPERLVVEVVERDMLDHGKMRAIMRELRALGVRIAIDDFGTGQSSLSRLGEINPDYVKLDRSFVAPLDDPTRSTTLVRGVISLAHDLGAVVVGEGVETQQQFDKLRDLGCDAMQGFLLGRPKLITQRALSAA
jgi:diguanylate cyclase